MIEKHVNYPGRLNGRHHRRRHAITGVLLLLPAMALVLSFILFPVFYNVWLGFYEKHSFMRTVSWVGLKNYLFLLNDPRFWNSFYLAAIYTVASTALQIIFGIAGALILHSEFRGRDFLRGIALFPYMVPTIIAIFTWRWLMNDMYGVIPYIVNVLHIPGMPEAWLSRDAIMYVLIFLSVWTFFPFVCVNVLARLQTISPSLYEAARVDGASAIKQFLHITLPELRSVLLIVVLLRGIWMFTKFDVPWLLGFGAGSGEGIRTLPVYTYQWAFAFNQAGMGAALSNFVFAMTLVGVTVYFIAFPKGDEE
jgi:multiple sugar transport system permease protein